MTTHPPQPLDEFLYDAWAQLWLAPVEITHEAGAPTLRAPLRPPLVGASTFSRSCRDHFADAGCVVPVSAAFDAELSSQGLWFLCVDSGGPGQADVQVVIPLEVLIRNGVQAYRRALTAAGRLSVRASDYLSRDYDVDRPHPSPPTTCPAGGRGDDIVLAGLRISQATGR